MPGYVEPGTGRIRTGPAVQANEPARKQRITSNASDRITGCGGLAAAPHLTTKAAKTAAIITGARARSAYILKSLFVGVDPGPRSLRDRCYSVMTMVYQTAQLSITTSSRLADAERRPAQCRYFVTARVDDKVLHYNYTTDLLK